MRFWKKQGRIGGKFQVFARLFPTFSAKGHGFQR
jgi:hypothetical protein